MRKAVVSSAQVVRRADDLVMAGVAAYRRAGKAMVEMQETLEQMARLRDELAAAIGERPREEVRGG